MYKQFLNDFHKTAHCIEWYCTLLYRANCRVRSMLQCMCVCTKLVSIKYVQYYILYRFRCTLYAHTLTHMQKRFVHNLIIYKHIYILVLKIRLFELCMHQTISTHILIYTYVQICTVSYTYSYFSPINIMIAAFYNPLYHLKFSQLISL